MQKQGMVFNIQRYSLHDGTGLRTLVFMKGCPLRCKWCANPEGLSKGYSLIYNDAECVGCGKCIPVCKQGAIYADHAGTIKWNKRLCTECMECVSVCIPHARKIVGSTFTVEELLQEVEKDSIFYRKKLIIRMPIIPGLNSSDENINRAADFVKRLKVVSRVDLLPYHNFGAAKYKKLKGVDDYTLDYLGAMAPDSLMEHLRDIMAKKGIPIRIGG